MASDGTKANTIITTFTGRQVDLRAMKEGDVDIRDIAHSLSLLCRYNGHCRRFYSVAQHCVLASRIAKGQDIEQQALLHDAAEAYLGDVVTPIKNIQSLGPLFRHLEGTIFGVIARRFRLSPDNARRARVKNIDKALFLAEARDLFPSGHLCPPPEIGAQPYLGQIGPWPPRKAEREYLKAARRLGVFSNA